MCCRLLLFSMVYQREHWLDSSAPLSFMECRWELQHALQMHCLTEPLMPHFIIVHTHALDFLGHKVDGTICLVNVTELDCSPVFEKHQCSEVCSTGQGTFQAFCFHLGFSVPVPVLIVFVSFISSTVLFSCHFMCCCQQWIQV